jgi:hypothetical protein
MLAISASALQQQRQFYSEPALRRTQQHDGDSNSAMQQQRQLLLCACAAAVTQRRQQNDGDIDCNSMHLGSDSAPCDQRLGSSSAACTSAATRRHAISTLATAQLFSSMHLCSDSATRDQRGWAFCQCLRCSLRCSCHTSTAAERRRYQLQQHAPRQRLGAMRSAPGQQLSCSAVCTSAATRRHANSAAGLSGRPGLSNED